MNNKLPLNLIQAAPKPEAFSSGGYGGRKGESGGVIAILTMIKEDLEQEVPAVASKNGKTGNFKIKLKNEG